MWPTRISCRTGGRAIRFTVRGRRRRRGTYSVRAPAQRGAVPYGNVTGARKPTTLDAQFLESNVLVLPPRRSSDLLRRVAGGLGFHGTRTGGRVRLPVGCGCGEPG